uniref:Uncharacterized protein n=1 Tax=Octopus bimaculoides TaxID=37653 RepID=A0A0L8GJB6_OCTBM
MCSLNVRTSITKVVLKLIFHFAMNHKNGNIFNRNLIKDNEILRQFCNALIEMTKLNKILIQLIYIMN